MNSIVYLVLLCFFLFFNMFIYFNWRLITLQYCIGFAIQQHESATGIHVFILNPSPSSFPIPCLWVVSVHKPQASSIMHWTWTGYSFHIWYYTCFNAILPNHPTLALSHDNPVCKTAKEKQMYRIVFWTEIISKSKLYSDHFLGLFI